MGAEPEPGAPIGRWGAIQAAGGRTVGEPCGHSTFCDDYDVDAWAAEANVWRKNAAKMRRENVPLALESKNSPEVRAEVERRVGWGDVALKAADNLAAADLGWLDSTKIAGWQQVQRFAKLAMEFYSQAIDQAHKYEVEPAPDIILDPYERPPVIPLPSLFPNLGLGVGLGLAAVVLLMLGGRSS